MFPPLELVSYIGLILITDELPAPADFLIHRFLSSRLKDRDAPRSKCIMLAVSEDIERIKAVASKSNINILQNGRFKHIDLPALLEGSGDTKEDLDGPRLRRVFDILSSELPQKPSDDKSLVILDDISTLEWLGFSVLDLSRFMRALRAVCIKSGATLVIRHHLINLSEPDALFQQLIQLCSYHIEIRPLSSGRSGAVSGELCMHSGPMESEPLQRRIPRPSALQYRLTDSGATFFNKGTSEGVL
ncbi:hypothetical protein F5I97DRAFT_1935330 [Phlebopus sp. FC_14]|nr:hypothetical protein F5I97DRAFT_1935330 [Phlebopus sp. FC_14]